MAAHYLSQRDRRKGRLSPLPSYAGDGDEKHIFPLRQSTPWLHPVFIRLPFGPRIRLYLPVPPPLRLQLESRFGRRRGFALFCFFMLFSLWSLYALARRYTSHHRQWPPPFSGDPPTLVYGIEDLRQIWQWEIASGHYQSSRPIPLQIGLTRPQTNPGIPANTSVMSESRNSPVIHSVGVGVQRTYLDIQKQSLRSPYPPRPVPGSIADLDIIMENCDFSTGEYVRDCLEVLRIGGGLESGRHLRRGKLDRWRYVYSEEGRPGKASFTPHPSSTHQDSTIPRQASKEDMQTGLIFRDVGDLEPPPSFSPIIPYKTSKMLDGPCDPDYPRLFHIFWTGPFTDKPYIALLSYLYTQNLGLHLTEHSPDNNQVCRPKLWIWINPGPAASALHSDALHTMFDSLAANAWSSPFLHPRFKDVIEFKLWNTTDQLDNIPEIKDEWRSQRVLFNSGGHKYSSNKGKKESQERGQNEVESQVTEEKKAADPSPTNAGQNDPGNIFNMVGSSSASDYDRLSVILSDMARFILCHRFGGTYLDADTIFLRDWEELWGWKGAFAYRWSRMERYNTAVLRLNKGSAIGGFLFRTALRNELDFHPMTVARYMKDSFLEPLLLRLPDALFDSAWLNTEDYQRERPPFPFFTEFGNLFEWHRHSTGAPQVIGFEGFFRGAYSYHFHNFWWKPFDPARNWPDLGPRFAKGEKIAKASLGKKIDASEEDVLDDVRDLEWAAVLKRTFEGYIRGERPNMYGEWLSW